MNMSIPLASPSLIPQLIHAGGAQVSWEGVFAALNAMEAGFYGSLRGGVQSTGRVVNWMRETSIAYIQTIQILFNLVNTSIVLYSAKKLLEEVQVKFSASDISKNAMPGMFASVPIALATGAALTTAVFLIHRLYSPSLHSKQTVGQVNVDEALSFQQQAAKVLHISKLVLNVALACFAKNRMWLALSIAATGYSLYKNMQIKWMTFSRVFPYQSQNPQVPITQLKADYHVLALPPGATALQEKCAICQDDDEQVDAAFCANHVFHRNCVADLSCSKSDSFLNNPKITKIATEHYTNGVYTHTSHSYSISVSQDNFPSCPICRDIPLQNDCDIEVTDGMHGKFDASVTIERPPVDRQYLFENLYAIYSVAQAGLAYLQTYHELAGAIFKIQKVMLITDVIGYAATAYYLYNKVNEKFNPQDSISFKVATVAAFTAAAVLSYFAVLKVNAYLRSSLVLKEILAQLNISPDILKTIDISWNSPLSHQLMQVLYINRMVSIAALSFFSEQRKTNLLSAAAQLASFAGVSNLKWIELVQTLEWPLQKVAATGGTLLGYLHGKSLKNLTMTSHYLVSSSCAASQAHLQAALQSIYTYTSNFFNGSTWRNYWLVTYTNGIETGRKLYYAVTLQNSPIDPCACGLTPTLTDFTIRAIDSTYGAVRTIIS